MAVLAPDFLPSGAVPDPQLTLGMDAVDDVVRRQLAEAAQQLAAEATPPTTRAELTAATARSGNDPRRRRQVRPVGQQGSRADGSFTLPSWWRSRLPDGWRPASRVEALALWVEIEHSLGRGPRGWYRPAREWRHRLYRIWVMRFLTPSTNTLTASAAQLCAAYLARHGVPMCPLKVGRFLAELRAGGFALEVEAASGLSTTGRRSATYALLVQGTVTSTVDENVNPQHFSSPNQLLLRSNHQNARGKDGFEIEELWTTQLSSNCAAAWKSRHRVSAEILRRIKPPPVVFASGQELRLLHRMPGAFSLTRALRGQFDRGWTGFALFKALCHHPDGSLHPPLDNVRSVIGTLLYRIALWGEHPPEEWTRAARPRYEPDVSSGAVEASEEARNYARIWLAADLDRKRQARGAVVSVDSVEPLRRVLPYGARRRTSTPRGFWRPR